MFNNYNPYFNPQIQMQPQVQPQRFQTPDQQYVQQMQNQQAQPIQQNYKPIGLQGKAVDSIDVVKATEPAIDGSVIYFPLLDGTAIITKQLQMDGTSKITVYKPAEINEDEKIEPKYVTEEDITKLLEKNENKAISEIKNDIKNIKRQIEDIEDDIFEKTKPKK